MPRREAPTPVPSWTTITDRDAWTQFKAAASGPVIAPGAMRRHDLVQSSDGDLFVVVRRAPKRPTLQRIHRGQPIDPPAPIVTQRHTRPISGGMGFGPVVTTIVSYRLIAPREGATDAR